MPWIRSSSNTDPAHGKPFHQACRSGLDVAFPRGRIIMNTDPDDAATLAATEPCPARRFLPVSVAAMPSRWSARSSDSS
ncbi:hypothetical protein FRACA_90055 [Frankia canadensis]|uniref:Uncharacterized protein n=1 Tax=Frankia canadensis TaxID=1836972 RepID=A0A2I2L2B0_9ACTN|nr:hypothetical protein FRACA_90055 [Frankia canadensis]SOU59342.1 hypothetical protein FRACA_90055 [Frankia canadensis]